MLKNKLRIYKKLYFILILSIFSTSITKEPSETLFHQIDEIIKEVSINSKPAKRLYQLKTRIPYKCSSEKMLKFIQNAQESYLASEENENDFDKLTLSFAAKASCIHYRIIFKNIFEVLKTVIESIEYWKDRQKKPIRYFFERGPYQWLFGKWQKEELEKKIKTLQSVKNNINRFAGKLNRKIQTIVSKSSNGTKITEEELYNSILQIIKESKDFLTINPLTTEQTVDSFFPEKSDTKKNNPNFQLIGKILENIYLASTYKEFLNGDLKPLLPNSHIRRNWILYSFAASIAATAGKYLYESKEYIPGWFEGAKNNTITAVKAVTTDRIENLRKIWNGTDRDTLQVDPKNIKLSESTIELEALSIDLRREAVEFEEMIRKWAHGYEMDTKEQRRDVISDSTATGRFIEGKLSGFLNNKKFAALGIDLYEFLEYTYKTGSSVLKVLFDRTKQVDMLVQQNLQKVDEILHNTQQVSKAVRIPAEIIGMTPAILAIFLSAWGSKKIYNKATSKKHIFNELKINLKKITETINRHYQNNTNPSLKDEGKLAFLFYQLRENSPIVLNGGTLDLFLLDIDLISSINLSNEEKLKRISDMYNKYYFLKLA